MSKDSSKNENDLFQEVSSMIESIQPLVRQNLSLLTNQVGVLIKGRERDDDRIQRLLDSLLDYAGMCDEGIVLFKRLCRYYYDINPQVNADYIGIYRDLYGSEENGQDRIKGCNECLRLINLSLRKPRSMNSSPNLK